MNEMRRRERVKSALLVALVAVASAVLSYWLLGLVGAVLALVFTLVAVFAKARGEFVLRLQGARALPSGHLLWLETAVARLARRAGLGHAPRLFWINSPLPSAMATETSDGNGAIALTQGLLEDLTPRQIEGVLAHELSHLVHQDTRWTRIGLAAASSGRVLLSITTALAILLALLNGTGVAQVAILLLLGIGVPTMFGAMLAALSRSQEFSADARAAQLTGDPRGLASALVRIDRRYTRKGVFAPTWLQTHPATQQRVARLLSATL